MLNFFMLLLYIVCIVYTLNTRNSSLTSAFFFIFRVMPTSIFLTFSLAFSQFNGGMFGTACSVNNLTKQGSGSSD